MSGMSTVVDLSFEELQNEVSNKKAKFYLNGNTRWPVEMFRQKIHIGNLGEAEVRKALESGRIYRAKTPKITPRYRDTVLKLISFNTVNFFEW